MPDLGSELRIRLLLQSSDRDFFKENEDRFITAVIHGRNSHFHTPDLQDRHKEQLLAHSPPIPKGSSAQSTAAPSFCPFPAAQRMAKGHFHKAGRS